MDSKLQEARRQLQDDHDYDPLDRGLYMLALVFSSALGFVFGYIVSMVFG